MIRAEIESQREEASKKHSEDEGLSNYYFGLNDGLKDARDIIDKYIADKEQEGMTNGERTCELVKIVAKNDIGKPLANDKVTYLLDKQTMTVYAPWANCEMLDTLGLTIIDLLARSDKE